MNTAQEFINEVALHASRLNSLFLDPQPGLPSWVLAVGNEMNWLTDWWAGKFGDWEVAK